MARRDYGAGSIYQRCETKRGCPEMVDGDPDPETGKPTRVRPKHKCKGRWVGSIDHGTTERGTRRRITVTADTESQAKVKLRKRQAELDDGASTSVSSKTTVKQWATEWLNIVVNTLAPNSFTSSQSAVKKWIIPTIGQRRLDEVTPADVRKVTAAQRAAGLAESSRLRSHSTLITMLKAARQEGYAVQSRAIEVKPPAKGSNDRTDMEVDEAVKVLGLAAEKPDGSRVVAALLQGLRQGEALGLTRDAIDWDADLITISWQLQPLPYRHGCVLEITDPATCGKKRACDCPARRFRVPDGHESIQIRGRQHLVRPKSDSGWRVIPMVPWMRSTLEAWLEVAPESPHGLVWYHPKGDPTKIDDAAWYQLQDAAGVHHPSRVRADGTPAPYTIHETRHTTATLLLEAGVSPEVIIAILGHSSMLSTRSYLHVKTAPLREAMEKVAERLAITPKAA